jgi:hypothetical protein
MEKCAKPFTINGYMGSRVSLCQEWSIEELRVCVKKEFTEIS